MFLNGEILTGIVVTDMYDNLVMCASDDENIILKQGYKVHLCKMPVLFDAEGKDVKFIKQGEPSG